MESSTAHRNISAKKYNLYLGMTPNPCAPFHAVTYVTCGEQRSLQLTYKQKRMSTRQIRLASFDGAFVIASDVNLQRQPNIKP